jgi:hypothetical protein
MTTRLKLVPFRPDAYILCARKLNPPLKELIKALEIKIETEEELKEVA